VRYDRTSGGDVLAIASRGRSPPGAIHSQLNPTRVDRIVGILPAALAAARAAILDQVYNELESPRFRRDPCARDVALDPGGTPMPRITALLMLRSTMKTVSAPAIR
jgi:hypothetical protein